MRADDILDRLRTVVLVVDDTGTIEDARGGHGGFFGHDLDSTVGRSVFDFVATGEVDDLAVYFLESAVATADTASLPLPFRVTMLDADGLGHPVDVIPSGFEDDEQSWRWVVMIVPVAMTTSVVRSLEAEMEGLDRASVKRMLTEELAVDNDQYSSRWFLVELRDPVDRTEALVWSDEPEVAGAIERAVHIHGWAPWEDADGGETVAVDRDDLPADLRALVHDRGWRRVSIAPVHVDGTLVAAFVLFGRVPADYDTSSVNTNVRDRFRRLVDVTALLFARWRDQDRLTLAATRDSLTGLVNREVLAGALSSAGPQSVILYVDIDHFKAVNDLHGHDVGDQVLVEVSQRIVDACRPTDAVARVGGDEFVVLLDDVDLLAAEAIGRRVVGFVSAPIHAGDVTTCVSVSVGMAATDGRGDAVDAADQAMLRAKRGGRSRLVLAD